MESSTQTWHQLINYSHDVNHSEEILVSLFNTLHRNNRCKGLIRCERHSIVPHSIQAVNQWRSATDNSHWKFRTTHTTGNATQAWKLSARQSCIKVLHKNTHSFQAQHIPCPHITIDAITFFLELHTVVLESSKGRKHRAKNTRIHCVTDRWVPTNTNTPNKYMCKLSVHIKNIENETRMEKCPHYKSWRKTYQSLKLTPNNVVNWIWLVQRSPEETPQTTQHRITASSSQNLGQATNHSQKWHLRRNLTMLQDLLFRKQVTNGIFFKGKTTIISQLGISEGNGLTQLIVNWQPLVNAIAHVALPMTIWSKMTVDLSWPTTLYWNITFTHSTEKASWFPIFAPRHKFRQNVVAKNHVFPKMIHQAILPFLLGCSNQPFQWITNFSSKISESCNNKHMSKPSPRTALHPASTLCNSTLFYKIHIQHRIQPETNGSTAVDSTSEAIWRPKLITWANVILTGVPSMKIAIISSYNTKNSKKLRTFFLTTTLTGLKSQVTVETLPNSLSWKWSWQRRQARTSWRSFQKGQHNVIVIVIVITFGTTGLTTGKYCWQT